jgi:hypothetical protein
LPIRKSLKTLIAELQIPWVWFWAVLFSILLHLIIFGSLQLDLPSFDFEQEVIEAELVPLPPPVPQTAPRVMPKKAKQLKPASQKKAAVSPDKQAHSDALATSQPNISVEDTLDTEPRFFDEPALPPPTYVDLYFDVKRLGFGSAKAHIRYQAEPEGRYSLRSEAEAKGLASLAFSGQRFETSLGRVTERGLQPDSYRYALSGKPDKAQIADFDWEAMKLTIKNAKTEKVLDLPEGTQDFLSFLFQFIFVPPLNRMQYALTNGRTLMTYDYLFVGEDEIETPMGKLNTFHIAKSSGDPDEKTEVWLAMDYRFIPIKILKIAKDGSGFELTATRLDTDIAK